jgi:hypothetical protein
MCSDALPSVVQAILDRRQRNPNLGLAEAEKFILDTIERRAPLRHSFEVVWSLFLARGLKITLKRAQLAPVFEMESSVSALVTMDMGARGQIIGGVDQKYWKTYANTDGLKSDMWLLAYEAARKGWWQGVSAAYAANHPLFGLLFNQNVFFYDEKRNVATTLAELLRLQHERRRLAHIFRNLPAYS